ncbi:MAG: BtaA family protein [Desulfovibrio sp.]|nr:BtaA family protein [Desulfovibrio sp.]MBI4959468.1 BtaA family protein [Desulfovibrio sp.]
MSQSCAGLLKAAVRQSPAFSGQGILERLFCHWFSGFVYNQIWEDPRTDIEAMALQPHHRVLTIASGGCNICHYLLEGVESVTAVDLNIHHVHLSRLKLEAARRLPTHEAFFRFFGHADDNANIWAFTRHIEPHLPADTAKYWQTSASPWGGPRITMFAQNLYEHARMGQFLRMLRNVCRLSGRNPERILEAKNREEQRAIYTRELEPLLTGRLAKFFSKYAIAVFSLGIPPQQYRALAREYPDGVLKTYRKRVEKLACGFDLSDNPFAWQAFGRRYDKIKRQAIPDYLRQDNFQALKSSVDRASVVHDSLDSHLRKQPARSLDRFVLLDSQDWMTPEALRVLWGEMERTARPGARVIFRTAGKQSPVETTISHPHRSRFHYQQALSLDLTRSDRSCIYGGFHLYVMED